MYTLLGTLAGALLYGVLEPTLMSLTKPNKPVKYQLYVHCIVFTKPLTYQSVRSMKDIIS